MKRLTDCRIELGPPIDNHTKKKCSAGQSCQLIRLLQLQKNAKQKNRQNQAQRRKKEGERFSAQRTWRLKAVSICPWTKTKQFCKASFKNGKLSAEQALFKRATPPEAAPCSGTLQRHQHARSKMQTCNSCYTWSKNSFILEVRTPIATLPGEQWACSILKFITADENQTQVQKPRSKNKQVIRTNKRTKIQDSQPLPVCVIFFPCLSAFTRLRKKYCG